MRSGELARASDISPDTIRHYERLGLLPKPPRTAGGYRNYPAHALTRVRLIRRALGIGFSLPELTTLLKIRDRGEFPCHETAKLARRKLQELERQIRDLIIMREKLELILRKWDVQLARTGKGTPAKLLENLPDSLIRVQREAAFKKNRRSNGEL